MKNNNFFYLNDVKYFKIKQINEENGNLIFFEESEELNFKINRIFSIKAEGNSLRGLHSHYKCAQLLYCAQGEIIVTCDDLISKKNFN